MKKSKFTKSIVYFQQNIYSLLRNKANFNVQKWTNWFHLKTGGGLVGDELECD